LTKNYIGRFAPSPTGPLHYGSLVAALASFLDARHAGGKWLVRIEDLDPPRESQEAPIQILTQLQAYGLHWDDDVLYQSQRHEAYQAALSELNEQNLIYPCTCTRKTTPTVYPGFCRNNTFASIQGPFATRVKVPHHPIQLADRRIDSQTWNLTDDVGDFIIKRKDNLYAYQLAVVVDDIFQSVNQIVRGLDLLESTPRQLALYEIFASPAPTYLHLPILVDDNGIKLSKQAHARPIPIDDPRTYLNYALKDLGQPEVNPEHSVDAIIAKAIDAWDATSLPAASKITAPNACLTG
jgi:glutamyl-Q tRNA(Asp) synthetase